MIRHLVAIPLYNKADTIQRAIASVNRQSVRADILVIDDGSTDLSAVLVERIELENLTFVKRQNKGVSATRNEAMSYALAHEYTHLSFLDADDFWLEKHLEQIEEMIHSFPNADVFACNYQLQIRKRKRINTEISGLTTSQAFLVENFFTYNHLHSLLSSSSICLALKNTDLPNFRKDISHGEDTDYWIRLGLQYKIAYHPQPTVVVDRTASGRVGNLQMKKRKLLDLDQYEPHTSTYPGLARYLDLNRFAIAIGFRLENDIKNATDYQHKIDPKNLSDRQNKLLKMNRVQLKSLKKTQQILGHLGLRLRTGR
ncbi:glycosyltransferase family 2 protein [Nonlabens xiamenensis]|uniref:glycosyltransferase family 2 protein n=1 Tax=Nonlabens xiamenensis TaxID=2341043 RepID=UPI000F610089|nr:glycosyltransferase family 2 protein [Nonlabens xiamenensis]